MEAQLNILYFCALLIISNGSNEVFSKLKHSNKSFVARPFQKAPYREHVVAVPPPLEGVHIPQLIMEYFQDGSSPIDRMVTKPRMSIFGGGLFKNRNIQRQVKIGQFSPTVSKACKCGVNYPKTEDRVTNGREAQIDQFPWMAAILRWDQKGVYQDCQASIINDRYLLTAAHCFHDDNSPREILLSLADHDLSTPTETQSLTVRAKEIISHAGYNNYTNVNDIALIKLVTPLKFSDSIIPICMPSPLESFAGKTAVIVGWGTTSFGGDQSDVQLFAEIKVMPNRECRRKYILAYEIITESMLCGIDPSKDACQGDSGGPLIVKMGRKYVQVGLVSTGKVCADMDHPGVYTRISSFQDWILENTKDAVYCEGSFKE